MNIIVSSNKEIKIVDNSVTDINKAKLFIANDLISNVENVKVSLKLSTIISTYDNQDLNYTLFFLITATHSAKLDKQNYRGFVLSCQTAIPSMENGYSAVLKIDNNDIGTVNSLNLNNILEDDSSVVLITDRTIAPITTAMVAEDRNSQQITFQIKEMYDGVSFLDDKKIFVDYIPVDKELLEKDGDLRPFLSREITEKIPIILDGENWIRLKWNVPWQAMKQQGVVKFSIAVVDEKRNYIWQTFASSFTVFPNLGMRPPVEFSSSDEASQFSNLITEVDNLKTLLGNQSNLDTSDDEEVLFNAGGAQ